MRRRTFVIVLSTLSVLTLGQSIAIAQQLPQVNMGGAVGTPGDNQYSQAEQARRHGAANRNINSRRIRTPVRMSHDVSTDPIAADEPITNSDFPPMPDRPDLGGTTAPIAGDPFAQRVAPNQSARPVRPERSQSSRERAEEYHRQKQLKLLGPEPRLKEDTMEPPTSTPVSVQQPSTQELSVPEEKTAGSPPKPNQRILQRAVHHTKNKLLQPVRNLGRYNRIPLP